MSDELSDPHASSPIPPPRSSESIPPPEEPKTPPWLTWAGLGLLLIVLGIVAVRCGAESEGPTPSENPPGAAAVPVKQ